MKIIDRLNTVIGVQYRNCVIGNCFGGLFFEKILFGEVRVFKFEE